MQPRISDAKLGNNLGLCLLCAPPAGPGAEFFTGVYPDFNLLFFHKAGIVEFVCLAAEAETL